MSAPDITRSLGDGAQYRITLQDDCLVLDIRDSLDGHAVVALTPVLVQRLRVDLEQVAGGAK